MSRIYMNSYGKILQPIDPDALTVINSNSLTTPTARRAVDFAVSGAKIYGFWGKVTAVYPILTASGLTVSETVKFNFLKDRYETILP